MKWLPTSRNPDEAQVSETGSTSSAKGPRPPSEKEEKLRFAQELSADNARWNSLFAFSAQSAHPGLWAAFIAQTDRERRQDLFEMLCGALGYVLPNTTQARYSQPPPEKQQAVEQVEQDSFLIHKGEPYMPLSAAARQAGIHRDTLLSWMKKRVRFNDEPIEAILFEPTGTHFISKRSVERIVNRFEKWPSGEPAGVITLEQTEQGSDYLSISEAASTIGVPRATLRRWVRENDAPLSEPLSVVRDTSSGYFYIQRKDVLRLAEHVKTFGVSSGPRSNVSIIPQLS